MLLQDFGVAVGEQVKQKNAEIHKRDILLMTSHKAKEKALAVLQEHLKWQRDQDSTTDAITELEVAIDNWLR